MGISQFSRIFEFLKIKGKTSWRSVNTGHLYIGYLIAISILFQSLVLLNALASTNNLSQTLPPVFIPPPTNRHPSSSEPSSTSRGREYKGTIALLTFISGENREINNCTGTYINYKNNCYLLTNEHCFSDSVHFVKVVDSDNQEFTKSAQDFIIDRSKDLAILSLQSRIAFKRDEARQNSCNLAPSYSEKDIQKIKQENESIPWVDTYRKNDESYFVHSVSLGYVNKELFIFETSGSPYRYGPIERIKTSLNMDYLIKVSKLQMYKGMSGGPVFSENILLGIKPTFISEQYVTHVIPTNEILEFIERQTGMSNSSISQLNTIITPPNSFAFGGENSGTHGGENSGTHGGENSGSNGTDAPLSRLRSYEVHRRSTLQNLEDVLTLLQEPEEGIILNPEAKERLLAVCTTNPCSDNTKKIIQIDGRDEWNEIKNSFSDNNLFLIYENSDYFIKNKDKILDRVFPSFAASNPNRGGVSYISLKSNATGSLSTQNQLLGHPVFTIDNVSSGGKISEKLKYLFSSSKNAITVNLFVSNFSPVTNSLREVSFPSKDFKFHFELSKSKDIISVKEDDGTVYECKNSYFYKIICFTKGKILSFSRSKVNKDTLHLRFAEIVRSNPESEKFTEGIIYYYSALEIKND